ncbi:MAG TPA: hypothetical protein VLA67_09495 [Nitrospiraceae bacterium]|nr:hypothetical protein [Nitrospiraceae bacterium]
MPVPSRATVAKSSHDEGGKRDEKEYHSIAWTINAWAQFTLPRRLATGDREYHREGNMKRSDIKAGRGCVLAAAIFSACAWLGNPADVSAQNMADYTNYPIFLNQNAPPNVLFLVDFGNATLEAAYSGTNHQYPISFKAGATFSKYASNVTVDNLVAVDNAGVVIATATPAAPADVFNPSKKYYGIFDPERCYINNGTNFIHRWAKVNGAGMADFTVACNDTTSWDGNFLNWLTMRKQEMIYQVLVGGRPLPASSNTDGTAQTLAGAKRIGENGSTASCNNNSNSCWRFVKFAPTTTLWPGGSTSRVPNTLPVTTADGGIFFGMGDGTGVGNIYVNDDATVDPFNNAPANRYNIQVDLTTEPDVPAGTGNINDNCIVGDPSYAGHRICYRRDRSWGIFQKMRLDNMHVGIMFVNSSTGNGGSLQYAFDSAFGPSDMTNIRNEHTEAYSPLAEALYEGLCLYRKSQGPCYNNGGSWPTNYNSSTNVAGDPFYFVTFGQKIRCCKNFVLMISPGIGVNDGNNPDQSTPFPTNLTMTPTTNLGVVTTAGAGDRLDDVASYGRTYDIRSDLGGTQYVSFYAVNAMGGPIGAALLASAAKYGGFDDKDKNNAVNLAGSQSCTYPSGSNLGTGSSTSNSEWDSTGPTGMPDCVPDTFFDASEGGDLEGQINAALNDILRKSASGTSISVLASSSNGEGSIYQAFFYPSTQEGNNEIKWTGYLQGIFIDTYGNLREDRGGPSGAADGKLIYTNDNIVTTEIDTLSGDVIVKRYADSDGDGKADSATPYDTGPLREMQGIWEAGKKLALRDLAVKPRNLFTWVDLNGDGIVTANEQMPFTTANSATLAPFLRATATGPYTATNIINFIQGYQVSGMRDRQLTVNGSLQVWRLGDIVNSSPTIVGPPRERFDILYGDLGYRQYIQRWAKRRQTAYVGANDGMLHAFNVGYYHRGDDPNTLAQEHGWYTTAPTDNSSGAELGEELWGFVPYYILPQLMWYTQSAYTHISYVDLKPKVTDVRIFTPEAACGGGTTPTATGCIHPDGWGTILILGMRFGGSCGICASASGTNNGGPPLAVTANFNGSVVETRYFYSGYIVLDITDPEATPQVLSAFSDWGLGLTTGYPTVVRISPKGDGKNDHTNARWMMLLGSGVHGYDGRAAMYASMYGVLLVQQGTFPSYFGMPVLDQASGTLTYKSSFMSDLITYDRDLDFRSDAVYGGRTISGGASCSGGGWSACGTGLGYWTGKMYRLTMGTCTTAPCSVLNWGVIDSGWLVPTEMVTRVPIGGLPVPLGPVTTSPAVTLDNSGNSWLFFGTGRFLSSADKTDQNPQYLVGVKDSVVKGTCTQSSISSCQDEDLLEVTNAEICVSCASGNQVQGVGSVSTFSGLTEKIQGNVGAGIPAMDGWVVQLLSNASSPTLGAERSIVNPTLIGGAAFFPTFTPNSDICVATGTSQIYGLYYLTGTGYTDPIFGVDAAGKSVRSVSAGEGVASSVAIQIGASPTGMAGFFQSSNSAISKLSPKAPSVLWSQFMAWIDQRT